MLWVVLFCFVGERWMYACKSGVVVAGPDSWLVVSVVVVGLG